MEHYLSFKDDDDHATIVSFLEHGVKPTAAIMINAPT